MAENKGSEIKLKYLKKLKKIILHFLHCDYLMFSKLHNKIQLKFSQKMKSALALLKMEILNKSEIIIESMATSKSLLKK